jgi:uncharacterized PurR-regulated membrane protein YhhQ (DUF165 family)
MKRSATDIVVIVLSCTVAATLLLAVLAIVVSKALHPEADFKRASEVIGSVITTIVGALVGFIGGRVAGRREIQNGNHNASQD